MDFVDGTLDPGETRAVPLIQATVAAGRGAEIAIVDAPPGTSCSAVAAVEDADLVLLVCEPTVFGLHDLELSLQMCEALGLETVAVVNRSDLGNDGVRSFLSREGVPVLAEIPFDREIAAACAAGALASHEIPGFAATMDGMAGDLLTRCGVHP
jgi:MinD superfamily P-loop ATPase